MSTEIIIAVLASTGLWKILEKLLDLAITKWGKKKTKVDELEEQVKSLTETVNKLANSFSNLSEKLDNFITTTNDRLAKIEQDNLRNKQDNLREQMLILMNHYPNDTQQLLTLAHEYFVDLKGNFASIFKGYCEKQNIKLPDWFDE